jgi:hypothetical protein
MLLQQQAGLLGGDGVHGAAQLGALSGSGAAQMVAALCPPQPQQPGCPPLHMAGGTHLPHAQAGLGAACVLQPQPLLPSLGSMGAALGGAQLGANQLVGHRPQANDPSAVPLNDF